MAKLVHHSSEVSKSKGDWNGNSAPVAKTEQHTQQDGHFAGSRNKRTPCPSSSWYDEGLVPRQPRNLISANPEDRVIGNQALYFPKIPYRVVHAIPGRMRFRVPRMVRDREYAQRLQGLVELDTKIASVRVNYAAGCIVICYVASAKESEIRSVMATLILIASQSAGSLPATATSTQKQTSEEGSSWSRLKLPAFAAFVSLLGGPVGLSIPSLIIRGAIALAALPVVKRTWESLFRQRRVNVDFLDLSTLAISTAQGHFLTSSSMLALIELGEAIRDHTARSSQQKSLDLLGSLACFVWVERNGEKQQVPLEEVQPGDTVVVYPGDQIPVDGSVLRGQALINEQKLTGESMPVVRNQGKAVYASTLVQEGQLYIQTERVGADTRAGQTIQLVQNAPVHDTRMENYAAKIADRAVLPTLFLGGAVFAVTRSATRVASVLTLDFATGIRVSVPTTALAALTQAARRGILIRSGRALEQLAQADAIVFDKTGTLTQGEIAIAGIKTADASISPSRVLEIAAAAEQRITHPVAEAIVRYAQEQGAKIAPRQKWEYQVGLGVWAEIDGQTVLVGSKRCLQQEGISLEPLDERYPELQSEEYSLIYVACEGKVLGGLQYKDPLRSESQEAIKALRTQIGTEIHLLTGDRQQQAQAIATELGIPSSYTHADAFPEHKAEVVQRLHQEGKTVAFVGDGLNDSAALAYADVSVSFRDGSDIARETAGIVLMNNDLRSLVEAVAIASNAKQIIHQNTGIVAIPNLSGLVLAATFGLNPMLATLINNGCSVIAGANGLRPVLNGQAAV